MTAFLARPFRVSAGLFAAALLSGCVDEEVPDFFTLSPSSATLSAEVGGEDRAEVVIQNRKRKAASLRLPELPPDLAWDTAAGSCGDTLASGAQCSLVIVFTPSSAYRESYTVEVDDAGDDDDVAFTLEVDSEDAGWGGVRYVHDEGPAEGEALATDEAGNVYLAGLTRKLTAGSNTALQGFYVTRYSRKGEREWTTRVHSTADHLLWGADSLVAGHGQVCFLYPTTLTGTPSHDVYTTLQCLDARTGTGGWTQALGTGDDNSNLRGALAMAANGDLLVGDSQGPADDRSLHLFRFSPVGVQQWHRAFDNGVNVLGIDVTSDGFVITGSAQGDAFGLDLDAGVTSGLVARLDGDGMLQWAEEVGRVAASENVSAWGAAVDDEDRIYVATWRTENEVADPATEAIEQVRLVALDGDGASRWTRTLPLTGVGGYAYDVAVSRDGSRVFVAGVVLGGTSTIDALPELEGYSSAGGMMAMYDGDGDLQWIDLLWTQEDGWVSYYDVGFTPGGDALVAGNTRYYHLDGSDLPADIVPGTSGEMRRAGLVARFAPDGSPD